MKYIDFEQLAQDNENGKLRKAPSKGYMLAYTRTQVIIKTYESLYEIVEQLKDQKLLELHLFDDEREYRIIATRSQRFNSGMIEHVAEFSEDETETIYEEEAVLKQDKNINTILNHSKITVLNHIQYTDRGTAYIDDYRLKVGGVCDG